MLLRGRAICISSSPDSHVYAIDRDIVVAVLYLVVLLSSEIMKSKSAVFAGLVVRVPGRGGVVVEGARSDEGKECKNIARTQGRGTLS
jgi:hypothetical protein